jgi:hypothetical protein
VSSLVELVESTDDVGNPAAIEKQLREAVTTATPARSPSPPQQTQQQQQPASDTDATLPEKLRGKTREEIAAMYVNLESINGRMANDLGAQRRLTDQFLELKRREDLSSQRPAKPKPQVKVDELLDRPTETLERFSEDRERQIEERVNQRLAALEGNLARTAFVQKHADYETVANDPEFVRWVQGSQYRLRVAQAAYNGDWNAADELLTEFKSIRPASRQQPASQATPAKANMEAAKAASLESSNAAASGTHTASEKIYRRTDLMALRLHNPDAYYDDGFQAEIMKAYQEGRVK